MITFEPLHPHFVAEVRGFDMREAIDPATAKTFEQDAWRPGDLVLWDNRAVMHRGCRYDFGHIRDRRRTTVPDLASLQERDCGDDGICRIAATAAQ